MAPRLIPSAAGHAAHSPSQCASLPLPRGALRYPGLQCGDRVEESSRAVQWSALTPGQRGRLSPRLTRLVRCQAAGCTQLNVGPGARGSRAEAQESWLWA